MVIIIHVIIIIIIHVISLFYKGFTLNHNSYM